MTNKILFLLLIVTLYVYMLWSVAPYELELYYNLDCNGMSTVALTIFLCFVATRASNDGHPVYFYGAVGVAVVANCVFVLKMLKELFMGYVPVIQDKLKILLKVRCIRNLLPK